MGSRRSRAVLGALGLLVAAAAVLVIAKRTRAPHAAEPVALCSFSGVDFISLEHVRNLLRTRSIDVTEAGSRSHLLSVAPSALDGGERRSLRFHVEDGVVIPVATALAVREH